MENKKKNSGGQRNTNKATKAAKKQKTGFVGKKDKLAGATTGRIGLFHSYRRTEIRRNGGRKKPEAAKVASKKMQPDKVNDGAVGKGKAPGKKHNQKSEREKKRKSFSYQAALQQKGKLHPKKCETEREKKGPGKNQKDRGKKRSQKQKSKKAGRVKETSKESRAQGSQQKMRNTFF